MVWTKTGTLVPASVKSEAGTLATRPVANTRAAGSLYFATDDGAGTLYRTDGTIWSAVGFSPTAVGELAYSEITSPFNVTAAQTVGAAPAFKDVTGLQVTVPAGGAFYLECGFMASVNPNGLTSKDFGVSVRIVDINNPTVSVAFGANYYPSVNLNIATGSTVSFAQRVPAIAVDTTYKAQASIKIGQNTTVPSGFAAYYVYAGVGYPSAYLMARRAN